MRTPLEKKLWKILTGIFDSKTFSIVVILSRFKGKCVELIQRHENDAFHDMIPAKLLDQVTYKIVQ